MSAEQRSDGPTCGCIGCAEDADVEIEHPTHGRRIVCERHGRAFVVIRHV